MIVFLIYTACLILITYVYPLIIRVAFYHHVLKFEHQTIVVVDAPFTNAWFTGLYKPVIVVTARLIDTLSHQELKAIIAHEKGHFQRIHIWRSLTNNILRLLVIIAGLGIFLNVLWMAVLALPMFYLSRKLWDETKKHEFEADDNVIYENLEVYMISALQKISNSKLTKLRIKRLQDALDNS